MDAHDYTRFSSPTSIPSVEGLQGARASSGTGQGAANEFHEEIMGAMKRGGPFPEVAREVMGRVEAHAPEALANLRHILYNNGSIAAEMRDVGWNGIKQQYGQTPDIEKCNAVRKEIVDGTWGVVLGALKEMGYPSPGSPIAFGTPGWGSDIDTVFQPSKELPESVAIVAKLMFDMVVLNEVGGLPGFTMDTESYLNHAGAALRSEENLKDSLTGCAGFARNEINASNLQMVRQLGGIDSPDWRSFKSLEIGAAVNPDHKDALEQSFADVEAFEREVNDGVQELVDAGQDPVMARMSYKTPGLVRLSEQMDRLKDRIATLEKESLVAPSFAHNGELSNAAQESAKIRTEKNDREIERARLQLGTMYLVRTSFFDEGYNTEGCYIAVCDKSRGQIHERGLDRAKEVTRKREMNLSSSTSSPQSSPVIVRKVLDRVSSAADLMGLSGISGRIRSRSHSLTPDDSASIKPAVSPRTQGRAVAKNTNQELLSKTCENSAMYLGHFHHKALTEGAQKAFVATSKYSERASAGALELLRNAKGCSSMHDYRALMQQVSLCHRTLAHVETAKRGQRLPGPVAERYLLRAIAKARACAPEDLPVDIQTRVQNLVGFTENAIDKSKFEGEIIPETILPAVFAYLIDVFTLDPDTHFTNSEEVNRSVCALVGLDKQKYNTSPLFRDVGEMTLECLQLDNTQAIEQFNRNFDILIRAAVYFVHNNSDILVKPTSDRGSFSLQYHWQNANI